MDRANGEKLRQATPGDTAVPGTVRPLWRDRMSNDEPLTFAMDRAAIWKAGLTLLKDSGLDYTPGDVTELAEYLSGDNIPYPLSLSTETGDEQQTDSSAEGTE